MHSYENISHCLHRLRGRHRSSGHLAVLATLLVGGYLDYRRYADEYIDDSADERFSAAEQLADIPFCDTLGEPVQAPDDEEGVCGHVQCLHG